MTEQRLTNDQLMSMSPQTIRYQVLTSHQELDGVSYLTYGIQCMGSRSDGWVQLDAVKDVSFQRDSAVFLADLFNRLQLSPVHFRDAVLDCVNA